MTIHGEEWPHRARRWASNQPGKDTIKVGGFSNLDTESRFPFFPKRILARDFFLPPKQMKNFRPIPLLTFYSLSE
jgi:hypothetical protein